jgi:3-oxoacyl-[acyl-carrier-protein] synthase II
MEAGPNYAKPMEFANSVINAASGQTAIWHNLWGVNATISGGAASGAQAIAYATDLIRTGRARSLLAGGVDELCFESAYGFYRVGLLYEPGAADAPPAPPFDARRSGLALGEASAFLMLEDAEAAAARGATVLAEVRGHGDAYDESRGQDEEGTAAALERAVEIALELSGLTAAELSCVSASANGDPRGDRGEAIGLARALGEAAARLPVVAIEAMLGETLGASGALQAVTLIESLRTGTLPGTAGLEETEAGFPLGRVTAECASVEPGRGLLTARSLGASCALVIEVEGAGAVR